MNIDYEMSNNAVLLKKCNKIYNIVTTIYAFVCGIYAIVTAFVIFLGINSSPLMSAFNGIILKAALFCCGFLACYKHETKFTLFAVLITIISTLIKDEINSIILVISFALSVLTAFANKKYHYLENQFGFPHFNERLEEQNLDQRQRKIKDEFQQQYEQYKKTSSSDMTDINVNYNPDNASGSNKSVFDKMDSI